MARLDGRRVLLTRSEARATSLARRLRAEGARVDCRATFELVPAADEGPVDEALARLDRYEWIAFTSANGVRFFSAALERVGRPWTSLLARCAAVGPATAAALARRGVAPDVVARDARAEGLADALGEPLLADAGRVLWVRPEQAREVLADTLRGLGARVDAVPFYRNVTAAGTAAIAQDLAGGLYDAAVFASPSALTRLLDAAGSGWAESGGDVRCVAIGPVTAAALEEAGLRAAAVAREPSDDGLFEAIQRVFGR